VNEGEGIFADRRRVNVSPTVKKADSQAHTQPNLFFHFNPFTLKFYLEDLFSFLGFCSALQAWSFGAAYCDFILAVAAASIIFCFYELQLQQYERSWL
jgi:hypothetical protein